MRILFHIPPEALTATTAFVYAAIPSVTPPEGFVFAGHVFDLEAYRNGNLLPNFVFSTPVTLTLHYSDADIADAGDEDSLALLWWNADNGAWEDAACGPYDRHPDQNWLAVPICQ